jgi:enoyl-CoA hydratase/carnithine racemase
MGWQRAAHVLFTSAWLDSEQAVEYGIALERCPDGEVLGRAMELARRVAAAPLGSLRAIKATMLQGHRDQVLAARAREDAAFAQLLGFG